MSRSTIANRRLASTLDDFTSEMEQMVDRFVGRPVNSVLRNERFVPSLDIAETKDEFAVTVDLPGVKPEDVKLEVQNDQLSISGKRESFTETSDRNFHRIERTSGEFHRIVMLPNSVDQDRIEANYDHGVLHVKLPKTSKTQPRKIDIKSNGSGSAQLN